MKKISTQRGSVIVSLLIVTLFLTTVVMSLLVLAHTNLYRSRGRVELLQAQYSAETAADAAIAILNSGNTSYTGTTSDVLVLSNSLYKSTYSVAVADGSSGKEKIITATGKVYQPATSTTPAYTRRIEVITQRSSTTTSSSIVSRNILQTSSGVKNIFGKDVYVNGYITMNKNTTNLVAENIIVGDKNTGAQNCSIGGVGNLIKPTSFSNPGQTKTVITMAYNNCLTPPGNTSNADFTVSANQSSVTKLQSTMIPWSQYMDSSYQNSPTGCNDWTTGSSPRDIPRTGNTKKTHYPDSSSGTSTSCGTSGDIALGSGQYNIKDNVHVRASFCASSTCTPIFNNPPNADGSVTIKFVFVEGSVNFDSVRTASGSGPIVLVSYATDPASKAASCPLGGAIYLNQGSPATYTDAPKLYLLASNGICLDKTKFGGDPALGGISGKNIYVGTNSGTPFDLRLDPTFPVDQIPVDLSWRATRYRRL